MMVLTLRIVKRGQKLTNGDVIKALFPKSAVTETQGLVPRVCFELHSGEQCTSFFDAKWWNAPYKAESEGEECEE